PRAITLSVATVATALLVAAAGALPVPYAISSPGPTRDTLGEQDGVPLIEISGAEVFPATGELLLTTVSVAGGPQYPVTVADVVRGWLDPQRSVSPVEEVFAPAESQDAIDERNQAAMISSQENATVAALEELGYEVPTTLTVVEAIEGTGAVGVVQPDDVIVAVDGVEVTSFSDLSAQLDAVSAGDQVALGVLRDGERIDLEITTTDDGTGGALLGVLVDPVFDFPVDVQIQIEDIGGPSAGTMFALGIVDLMTPEDEADGEVIAGTGTMDLTGVVGPIGGIRQKLAGAQRDGASFFLAPVDNCDEVVGNVPEGLQVVSVATLAEARAAVQAIGAGTAEDLPTCR
ncbi:MAG TPA: S16 family serine protease, partial [Actinotalea sp.]|nr:S16 family serine protease [Actinotalea sp.]